MRDMGERERCKEGEEEGEQCLRIDSSFSNIGINDNGLVFKALMTSVTFTLHPDLPLALHHMIHQEEAVTIQQHIRVDISSLKIKTAKVRKSHDSLQLSLGKCCTIRIINNFGTNTLSA